MNYFSAINQMLGPTQKKGVFFYLAAHLIFNHAFAAVAQVAPPGNEEQPIVQLVQTTPLEIDLAQPGMPTTAEVWLEMTRKAKNTIDLAQFYISSEPKELQKNPKMASQKRNLDLVIDELEKATKRGVRIRLLLSSSLLSEDPPTLERFKKMRGVTLRIYDMSRLTRGVMHAKYFIVDQKEVFVGSQNYDWRALAHTQELGVRVQDRDIARQLTKIFNLDWKLSKSDQVPPSEEPFGAIPPSKLKMIELVASPKVLNPPEIRSSIQALVELINDSKKSIQVQLMDYSPVSGSVYWADLDVALRAAALRGIKIQLLVNNGPTTVRAIDYLKSLSLIPGVEVKLATIPQFSGGYIPYARVIHSKYMIVDDDVFWIGTSNWGRGYFYNSRNIELIFRKPDLVQEGRQIFQRLWTSRYVEKVDPSRVIR
jgi:phosphatidylserine/phosphatidylglycerophosphate/cardiolipin synthase-like enzyme